MPDITITVTEAQARALRRLDPTKTVRQILLAHLAEWLVPIMEQLTADDSKQIARAYAAAPDETQDAVRAILNVPTP